MLHPNVKTHILDAKKLSLSVRGRLENGRHLSSRPNYNTDICA